MPLGASITMGHQGTHAGYRGTLSTLLDQNRISHQFVGSLTENPGQLPASQQHHEGHSGWTIAGGKNAATGAESSGLDQHLAEWIGPQGANPDIVLILVGSNDVGLAIDLPHAGARLDGLISHIQALDPGVFVYVSSIPVITNNQAAAKDYNRQVSEIAHARESRGEAVHFVDSAAVFSPSDTGDQAHPNNSGYDKIAHLWRDAILGL